MKKLPLFILLSFPLSLFAEQRGHDIVSGVRFGMPTDAAKTALEQFQAKNSLNKAGALRYHLVTSNNLSPGKLAGSDKMVRFTFETNNGVTLDTLNVKSDRLLAGGYDQIRTAWADFKDIADSKFKRLGGPGVFPEIAEFGELNKDVITDSYEAEGMHIDLLVRSSKSDGRPMQYSAILRIIPAAPSQGAAANK